MDLTRLSMVMQMIATYILLAYNLIYTLASTLGNCTFIVDDTDS